MSLTGYHTGRSLGKKNWIFICSGNIYGTPYQHKESGFFSSGTENPESFYSWLNGEMQLHGGVSKRLDLGLRVNSEIMIGLMSKYQLIGDKSSTWAVAVGAEYGILVPDRTYLQLPLYFSYHPNDRTSFYYSPRFAKEWNKYNNPDTSINYFGANLGFQTGKSVIFDAEIGFYRSVRFDSERYLPEKFQEKVLPIVGIGLIIPF